MRPAQITAALVVLGLCLIMVGMASAQQDAGIARLGRAIGAQEELNADLRLAGPRAQQEADQEAARLDQDERDLEAAGVTMSALRQARFDADTRRTRLAGAEDRARFFTDEVRAEIQQIAAIAARGGATFYTIFGRGSDGVGGRTTDVVTAEPSTVTTLDTAEDGAEILAAGTGGFVVRNLNDVSRALGLVARDTSTSYVMGYQPDHTVMDGKVRRIEVRPKTTELRVRARKGYVASPLPQMQNVKIGGGN